MPFEIVRNDIVNMDVDAIVNTANHKPVIGSGTDAGIHHKAGKNLILARQKIGYIPVGSSALTPGFDLSAKYVIHTVSPLWQDGASDEEQILKNCYESALELARENNCESIAFPLLATGNNGFPKALALEIAIGVFSKFLLENDMTVYVVVFDKASYKISEKLFFDICEYIDDNYVDEHTESRRERMRSPMCARTLKIEAEDLCYCGGAPFDEDLDFALESLDESFSQMLLRKIDESGMTDAQCYKRANIDRKLFSKIRSDINYKPSKPTVIAFAIALELSLPETEDMLKKAGFALSHSNKFDVIIEYFIKHGNYNVFEINEALFAFDQSLLGV